MNEFIVEDNGTMLGQKCIGPPYTTDDAIDTTSMNLDLEIIDIFSLLVEM